MLYLWGKKIERNNVIFEKGKKKGKKGITNDSLSLTLIHSLSLTPYPFPPIPFPSPSPHLEYLFDEKHEPFFRQSAHVKPRFTFKRHFQLLLQISLLGCNLGT